MKEVGKKLIAANKKARHDFSVEDVYECGIVLTGTEVKSLRAGRASLIDGFAMIEMASSGCTVCISLNTPKAHGPITHHVVSENCWCTRQSYERLHRALKIQVSRLFLCNFISTMEKQKLKLQLQPERKRTISVRP